MPAKLDDRTKGEIVKMRALDYDKQEIADELGISRHTVRRHLQELQREAEQTDDADAVVLGAVMAGILGASAGVALGQGVKALAEGLTEATGEENTEEAGDPIVK